MVLDRESNAMPAVRRRVGPSFLEFAGSWAGDDLEECLAAVYANRGPARF